MILVTGASGYVGNNLVRRLVQAGKIDRDLRVLSANAAFLKMTGKTEAEALGRKCHELLHADSRPCFENGEDCPVIKTFKTGKAYVSTHEYLRG